MLRPTTLLQHCCRLYPSTLKLMSSHAKHAPFKEVEASRPDFVQTDVVYTKVPNPDFQAGQGANRLPAAQKNHNGVDYKEVNPDEIEDKSVIYKLMISGVTPRPIAFVSTLSADGQANLAPMSYFNICGHKPPTLMVSISATGQDQRPSGYKDTAENIKEAKEFCVSIISEHFVEAANYTSIDAPSDIDEWALSGLTKRPSVVVKAPHVAESAFSMECILQHHYDMIDDDGKRTGTVFLGRIKRFHIMEDVLDPNDPGFKVMIEKLRPMSRLGGISYGRTRELMEIPRPVWDKVKDTPEVQDALRNA